jgi:hypothetical protein
MLQWVVKNKQETELEETERRNLEESTTFNVITGRIEFTALKFTSHCPLVLLVTVSWEKCKALGC